MKKIFFTTILFFSLLISCSTTNFISIKDTTIPPNHYNKPLFVTNNYYSSKSKFIQFFDEKVKTLKKVSKVNQKVLKKTLDRFQNNNTDISNYTIDVIIEEDKFKGDINSLKQNEELMNTINSQEKDLIITIFPSDVEIFYNYNSPLEYSKTFTYKYTITAIDSKTFKEVWKGTCRVTNPQSIFHNAPKKVSKKIYEKMIEDKIL